jgi:hypothetical protein
MRISKRGSFGFYNLLQLYSVSFVNEGQSCSAYLHISESAMEEGSPVYEAIRSPIYESVWMDQEEYVLLSYFTLSALIRALVNRLPLYYLLAQSPHTVATNTKYVSNF